ncbi:Hypothetical predicted protein [Cloeon dipterum]|uniref:Uncharacterized protein n=1 Tax=Cloeon dipterum TaxID=197152 RepID=A0A8S1DKD2_9INSE|nr:Hypothetical predicted protein [Cloeon dipterum]
MESPMQPRVLPKFPKQSFDMSMDQFLNANKLADFSAFRSIPEDIKTKQQASFRFIESTFPFYLPEKHHESSLFMTENSKGEYWGDAAHFLLSNKAHGFPLWSEFEKQIQSMDAKVLCMPHTSTNMTNLISKHKLHHQLDQAEGARYTTSPFVLAQLPFQPVLLYQWLTQSLFLLSNFEMQMRHFYAIPLPVKFKPKLISLHKLLKTTQRNIGFLFDYLQQQVESKQEIFVGNLKVFEIILNGVLPFLTFWNEKNGHLYVQNLKVKCWEHWNPDEKLFRLNRESMAFKKRNFLFNLDFWRGPSENLRLFGNSNEYLVRGRQDLADDATCGMMMDNHVANVMYSLLVLTKNRGRKEECLKKEMNKRKDIRKILRELKRWSSGLANEISDRGIIGLVLNINTKIELDIALYKAMFYIADELKISPTAIIPIIKNTHKDIDIETIESLVSKLYNDCFNHQFLSSFGNLYPISMVQQTDALDVQYEVSCYIYSQLFSSFIKHKCRATNFIQSIIFVSKI